MPMLFQELAGYACTIENTIMCSQFHGCSRQIVGHISAKIDMKEVRKPRKVFDCLEHLSPYESQRSVIMMRLYGAIDYKY